MAVGSSKIGVLGGLVSGGSETFNCSGTFVVPPGVRTISITGRGGTGNPGNAGNPGNPGNPGTGGGGAGGGGGKIGPQPYGSFNYNPGGPGGHAWTNNVNNPLRFLDQPKTSVGSVGNVSFYSPLAVNSNLCGML